LHWRCEMWCDCVGQKRRANLSASATAPRAFAAAPSFQACWRAFICTFCMWVCIYVYVCMCADMCICIYRHVCTYCVYTHVYVHEYAYLCIVCGSQYQCLREWIVPCMCVCLDVHIYACAYVCKYINMWFFFAVSVACTLQVFWALVHWQVCMLHRCVFTPTYTSATHLLQVVHTCIYVYMCVYACICLWMHMCVYDIAWHVTVEALLLRFSICAYVCIWIRMYMCVHVCVYRCICICTYMYICMSVYMYAYTFIYARVWVYIYTRVGAFCLCVLSNLSTTCACITGAS